MRAAALQQIQFARRYLPAEVAHSKPGKLGRFRNGHRAFVRCRGGL